MTPLDACPNCGSEKKLGRVRRRFWMRFLPGSKYIFCELCGCEFLLFLNRGIKLKSHLKTIICPWDLNLVQKSSRSLDLDFNYFLQISSAPDVIKDLIEKIDQNFMQKYCRSFSRYDGDAVQMVKTLFNLIAFEVRESDLVAKGQNHYGNKDLIKFPRKSKFLSDSSAIANFCREIGMAGFRQLLSSLITIVHEQQRLKMARPLMICSADDRFETAGGSDAPEIMEADLEKLPQRIGSVIKVSLAK